MTETGGPRYFDAVVDVVDDDVPSFAAWVSVSDDTVQIHAFDIILASWNTADITAVSSDDGLLLEVPGSMLCIKSTTLDELLSCLTGGVGTSAA